jgi:hypothetical protein
VGNDLVLEIGTSDSITFSDWYASEDNHSVVTLQIISESAWCDDRHGHDSHKKAKPRTNVQTLDFAELTDSFDESGSTDRWSLTNARLDKHLEHHNNDEEAMGGELASQYALTGSLDGMDYGAMQDVLDSSRFGRKPQHI